MQLAFVYKMHVNPHPITFSWLPARPLPPVQPNEILWVPYPKEKFYPATRRFVRGYISVQPSHYYLFTRG